MSFIMWSCKLCVLYEVSGLWMCDSLSLSVFPQWVGSPCGLHGPYVFYKAFRFHLEGRARILSLGDFFPVRCKPEDPVCIAELQLLWEERTSKQLLSSSKLYFLPEHTPQGRSVTHGEVRRRVFFLSSACDRDPSLFASNACRRFNNSVDSMPLCEVGTSSVRLIRLIHTTVRKPRRCFCKDV